MSEALQERAFFEMFREEAQREGEHLPKEHFKYGLGIFSKIKDLSEISFEKEPVEYSYGATLGTRFLLWKEAMADEEAVSLLRKYFIPENVPVLKNNLFASALSSFGGGLVVIIDSAKETVIDISSLVSKNGADFLFVVVKEGSRAKIFESLSGGVEFFGRTVFAVVEEGASLEITHNQNLSAETVFAENKFSFVGRGGFVRWNSIHTGGSFIKTDTEDFLRGEGAQSFSQYVSVVANSNADVYSASHHLSPHTISHINARSVAGSGAKIIYRGLVDIPRGMNGASGRQDGRFILVSPGAEVDAVPALDVGSRETSSSHALSISHLKKEDFFFPALRAIPTYHAQGMLLLGFLSKYLNNSPFGVKDDIHAVLSKKLSSPLFRLD